VVDVMRYVRERLLLGVLLRMRRAAAKVRLNAGTQKVVCGGRGWSR